MNRIIATLSLAALLVVSACAKRQAPEAPPPAPPQKAEPAPAPAAAPEAAPQPQAPQVRPGSLEDLIASAGADRVFFAYDSSDLDAGSQNVLKKTADWMKRNDSVRVTIEGHCDERGTREYNLALGERRASAVKSYLVSLGVRAARINTISYGKERPEVVGSDDESYARNRRGVTTIGG